MPCLNARASSISPHSFNKMKILKPAFDLNSIRINIENLEETAHRKNYRNLISYASILSSIREVGIIQPLVVCPSSKNGRYKILDGHIRFYALKELNQQYVYCIIANDDERYTFDAQINNLSTFQKAAMIAKAVKSNVPLERIAAALAMSEKQILSDMNVTEGLDAKVVGILRTANVTAKALKELRKVKNVRQIQIAQHMKAVHNFGFTFVSSLVASSLPCHFVDPNQQTKNNRVDFTEITALEHESNSLEEQAQESLEKYNHQIFELNIIIGFLKRLITNERINGYMMRNFSSHYGKLEKLSQIKGLIE